MASRQAPERTLLARPGDGFHPVVEVVDQFLDLCVGERTPLRSALVLVEMGHRVPLVADLRRHLIEAVPALLGPLVACIGEVVAEHPQREVVAPDRRDRTSILPRRQRDREVLHVAGAPIPGVGLSEFGEPAHQPIPFGDRALAEHPGTLLPRPAGQHRLEDRDFLVEMQDTFDQNQPGGPRRVGHKLQLAVAVEITVLCLTQQLPICHPGCVDLLQIAGRIKDQFTSHLLHLAQ